ncbi:MAG: redox-sensing transcriptional repressor Rex [Sphaerochaeta sp.]|jgi:redox-sensing transcriptional repressor|uniref:redox-sensing transcriptional repressor Rex n=1 Tax=Sphaerochaeta sp. TaxID=1972642 RepID=UPI002970B50D|nr:redox-sensing transcriptional repressor Rex [uncultured Sphaerochaeta sp.]MDD3057124.1 redox-sensing transcriptional repressor Rex [Sphaerochaeta sp.]MDD3928980.1 redox-sensing transcriptional repressor Rex [Sphaerochaeta sp.]NCC12890.1 redox-sensing transcriptional repressor Rex [Spirochaetia bacterium]
MNTTNRGIPIPTIKRFPSYLRLLKGYRDEGMQTVSATVLAEELGLKPIQVRKDISCTGIEGKPKVGFTVIKLIDAIIHTLGWDNATDAILIGAGHLGSALARYEGFESYGLKIVAAFDIDPSKCGSFLGEVPVFPLDQLSRYIEENHVNIGVLAVPAVQAQEVAELLVSCGILAIWNFAPKDLKLPERVVVQRTDLATSFAVLSAKVKRKMNKEELLGEEDEW